MTGFEQAIRYASILLDISDGTKQDFDELYIERNKAGSYWIHFAVRPTDSSATQGDVVQLFLFLYDNSYICSINSWQTFR